MKIKLVDCAAPKWLTAKEEMLSSVRIGNLTIKLIYDNFFSEKNNHSSLISGSNTKEIFWPIRYFPSVPANKILFKLNAYLTTYAGITFVTKQGEFIDITNVNIKKRIYINPSNFTFDIYDVNDYRKAFFSFFPSRSFNEIFEKNSSYIKKSHLRNKIISEYEFLTSVPENLQSFFVPAFNLFENKKYATYTMPKINAFDASYLALNGMFNESNTKIFFEKLSCYLKISTGFTFKKNKSSAILFNKKIKSRCDDLLNSPNINLFDRLTINHTNFKTYKEFSNEIIFYLSKNKKELNSELVFSHGDLCLSNILFDVKNDIFILIDPRGSFSGEDKFLSIYYDFAKLSHSINYGYDWILNNRSNVSLAENGDFVITHDDDFNRFSQNFYKEFNLTLCKFKLNVDLLDAVVCSLFLSMMPLHSESVKKQILFLLTAINIYKKLISRNTP
jgi:hypothetical protein